MPGQGAPGEEGRLSPCRALSSAPPQAESWAFSHKQTGRSRISPLVVSNPVSCGLIL